MKGTSEITIEQYNVEHGTFIGTLQVVLSLDCPHRAMSGDNTVVGDTSTFPPLPPTGTLRLV